MAFDNISSSQMYGEIMEIYDKLKLDNWELDFLENIKDEAMANRLSVKRRASLEEIYFKACNSPY